MCFLLKSLKEKTSSRRRLKKYLKGPTSGFTKKNKNMKILTLLWKKIPRGSFELQHTKEI